MNRRSFLAAALATCLIPAGRAVELPKKNETFFCAGGPLGGGIFQGIDRGRTVEFRRFRVRPDTFPYIEVFTYRKTSRFQGGIPVVAYI